jgi:hypothetical protein
VGSWPKHMLVSSEPFQAHRELVWWLRIAPPSFARSNLRGLSRVVAAQLFVRPFLGVDQQGRPQQATSAAHNTFRLQSSQSVSQSVSQVFTSVVRPNKH